MHLKIKNDNFHILSFKDRILLYDINRVKIYRSNNIEKDLLIQNNSHFKDYNKLIEKYSHESVHKAIERLNRLSQMSDSLAGFDGHSDYRSNGITNLWLNITNSCNLNCQYCYARDGGYENGPTFMAEDIAKAGINFFIQSLYPNKQGVILFTGGEPLLNFNTIKNAVTYAIRQQKQRGILFSFRILTNGTIMNKEILSFLSNYNIKLQISLDGPADIHDAHRKNKEGVGTFNKIDENIRFLIRNNFNRFSIRSTVCHQNADISNIVKFFNTKDLKDYTLIPVMTDNKNPFRLNQDDIKKLAVFYHEQSENIIADIKSGSKKTIPKDFAIYIEKLKRGIKTKRFCGAGEDLLVLTPAGDFYPCPTFTSILQFRIGSLKEGLNKKIQFMFHDLSVDKKETCRACWARNLCGGGCISVAYDANKDMNLPDPAECKIIKAKIKGAINVYDQMIH